MITLEYGNVVTRVQGTDEELFPIRHALTIEQDEAPIIATDTGTRVDFLSGLLPRVEETLTSLGIEYQVENRPTLPDIEQIAVRPELGDIELYDDQQRVIRKALYYQRGVISYPTGSGKTEISAALTKYIEEQDPEARVLMIVPGINPMKQAVARFKRRGIRSVGGIGDTVRQLDKQHIIGVVNSISRGLERGDDEICRIVNECTMLLFMEAHHEPAPTWDQIAHQCPALYRLALSATPFLYPDHPTNTRDYRLVGATGEVIAYCPPHTLMNIGRLATPQVHFVDVTYPRINPKLNFWPVLQKKCIAENTIRNNLVAEIAVECAARGKKVLTLVNQRFKHGHPLCMQMSRMQNDPVYFFAGENTLTTYKNGNKVGSIKIPITKLADDLMEKESYTVVGSPAVHEDADFPDANVLIPAGAGRKFGHTIQSAGRILRKKDEPNIVHIIDFWDKMNFIMLNQARTRQKWYEHEYGNAQKFSIDHHETKEELISGIFD